MSFVLGPIFGSPLIETSSKQYLWHTSAQESLVELSATSFGLSASRLSSLGDFSFFLARCSQRAVFELSLSSSHTFDSHRLALLY